MIEDYCHVGIVAVSSLTGAGYDVVKQRGIDISLFYSAPTKPSGTLANP
jgi:hypothetical protein